MNLYKVYSAIKITIEDMEKHYQAIVNKWRLI